MAVTRSDLDGQRLMAPGKPDVWLIFHGERHRVPSSRAYDSLFSETERLMTGADIDDIKRSEDLDDAVCLVRPEGGHQVFMVTGSGRNVRRYHITDYESFVDFGFDTAKVREVPEILVRALTEGEHLVSAARRK